MIRKSDNTLLKVVVGLVAVLLVASFMMIGSYNKLTSLHVDVEQAESKIDVMLQRRNDLIPNVVSSVKGYMSHEKEIFTDIADARAKIGSSNSKEIKEGQSEMSSAISRLLVLTENYPELKTDTHVQQLITELEGTENRILVARNDYNDVASKYNRKLRTFPSSVFASIFDFEKVEFYQADESAKDAPKVSFE